MAKGPGQKIVLANLPEHIRAVASVPGKVVCLRCRKKFKSADVLRLRVCSRCTAINDALFVKSEVTVQSDTAPLY